MSKIIKTINNPLNQQSLSSSNGSRQSRSFIRSLKGSECSDKHSQQQNSSNNCNIQQSEQENKKRPFLKKNSRQFLASSKSTNKISQCGTQNQKQKEKLMIKQKGKMISSFNKSNQIYIAKQQNKKYSQRQNSSRSSVSSNNPIIVTPKILPINNQQTSLSTKVFSKQRIKTQSMQLQHLSKQPQNDSLELNNSQILKPPGSGDLYMNLKSGISTAKVESFANCFIRMQNSKYMMNNSLENLQQNSGSLYIQSSNQKTLQTVILKGSKFNNSLNINSNFFSKQKPQPTPTSYFEPNQIQICPELLHIYRTEHLINEINGCTFSLRLYSKGRKQIKYADGTIELFYNNGNDIKLTRWANGDFKLVDGDKVSYWSEEICDLDQYFLN